MLGKKALGGKRVTSICGISLNPTNLFSLVQKSESNKLKVKKETANVKIFFREKYKIVIFTSQPQLLFQLNMRQSHDIVK